LRQATNWDQDAETARDLRDREAELKLEIDAADRSRHETIDCCSESV